jgi:Fic family protein
MKMPRIPPNHFDAMQALMNSPDRFMEAIAATRASEQSDHYRHWDIIRHLAPPANLKPEEWWACIKMQRCAGMKFVPLKDTKGEPFGYNIPDPVTAELHDIDLRAGGSIGAPDPLINPQSRNQYLFRSLVREAITSSQLEGAVTTREVAKEMLRSGRPPRDKSERMIMNNFLTMQQIRDWKNRPLDSNLVCEIHRYVTAETLERSDAAGRFRRTDESVYVQNEFTGEIFHTPPPAEELPARVEEMCRFANGDSPKHFVHPAIRAILLHFWLAYDHPFVDGNGRTARALFYWAMLRHQYWLFEYISISEILLKAPAKYALAFLHSETDGNDLTYFIIHQAKVISRAIAGLHAYIDRKILELTSVEAVLKSGAGLNYRQEALIAHALRNPGARYTIEAHRNSHNIAYETARGDLMGLANIGWLEMRKVGKAFLFSAPPDIASRIKGYFSKKIDAPSLPLSR